NVCVRWLWHRQRSLSTCTSASASWKHAWPRTATIPASHPPRIHR
ncbi:MAG: hypothetical protein, partial [Olavius algarvensis Gamma 1 endosymbiont]